MGYTAYSVINKTEKKYFYCENGSNLLFFNKHFTESTGHVNIAVFGTKNNIY